MSSPRGNRRISQRHLTNEMCAYVKPLTSPCDIEEQTHSNEMTAFTKPTPMGCATELDEDDIVAQKMVELSVTWHLHEHWWWFFFSTNQLKWFYVNQSHCWLYNCSHMWCEWGLEIASVVDFKRMSLWRRKRRRCIAKDCLLLPKLTAVYLHITCMCWMLKSDAQLLLSEWPFFCIFAKTLEYGLALKKGSQTYTTAVHISLVFAKWPNYA